MCQLIGIASLSPSVECHCTLPPVPYPSMRERFYLLFRNASIRFAPIVLFTPSKPQGDRIFTPIFKPGKKISGQNFPNVIFPGQNFSLPGTEIADSARYIKLLIKKQCAFSTFSFFFFFFFAADNVATIDTDLPLANGPRRAAGLPSGPAPGCPRAGQPDKCCCKRREIPSTFMQPKVCI
jgi:hypothetical protein